MHGTAPPIPRNSGIGVQVRGVSRTYDTGVLALDRVDLAIAPGEFVAILGPSGCGKSTLLRLIAGLDQPQRGTVAVAPIAPPDIKASTVIEYASAPLPRARRADVAYVFQDAHLLPWRSVLQNVALPLELMGMPRRRRIECARRAIEQVGLADAVDRYPAQLSGGMRMRVSLARAMVTDPKLLLLDEPFAALDEITRHRLDEQLRALWAVRGMTVLFVTHSTTEAVYLAQRAIVMSARPGRIVEDHRIELPPHRDASLRGTAAFARETRVLYDALERGCA